MKKTICKYICVFLLGIFVFCPSMVIAHGGGGGGGSEDGGADNFFSGSSSSTSEDFFAGGVSWTPNPNGPGVRGSSIYNGRPPNIEKGPYQSGTAVEDAEALLLAGYQAGNYTADELLEQLEWADRVGIPISEAASQTLDQMAVEIQQILEQIEKQEKKEKGDEDEDADKFGNWLNIVHTYTTGSREDKENLADIVIYLNKGNRNNNYTYEKKSAVNKKSNKEKTKEEIGLSDVPFVRVYQVMNLFDVPRQYWP